jgi:uncharacterized protein (TIGR02145 family)
MKGKKTKAASVIAGTLLMLCTQVINGQSFKDNNGIQYKTAKLGTQEWIATNLNTTKFQNGDIIPEAKTKEEWVKAGSEKKPAWCYYENDPENGKKYGKLYNWYAINDPRGLVPKGWHVATNPDWMTLVKNLLGIDYAGPKLKSRTGWKSKNGTDNIGFSALPGGYRDEKGGFKDLGAICQWWSNSEPVEVQKSNMIFSVMLKDVSVEISYVKMTKETGLTVRCVKDK